MKINRPVNVLVSVLVSALLMTNPAIADAKRLGGGSSVGRQSSTVTKNQANLPAKPAAAPTASNTSPAAKPAATAPAAPAAQPSRFGGMGGILGGVAAGIGLSYLFSQMGMGGAGGLGEGLASMLSGILMLAAVVFIGLFLYRRFGGAGKSSMTPAMAGMSPGWNGSDSPKQEPLMQSTHVQSTSVQPTPMATSNQIPLMNDTVNATVNESPMKADLTPSNWPDKDSFLQNAKALFIQLQEASDQQNLDKMREYTTPDLFNSFRQEMLSRTSAYNFTQVLTLAADLIAVEEDGKEFLTSVRFSGTLREEKDGPIVEFEEVWNWVKPMDGNLGWLLCGIQQVN